MLSKKIYCYVDETGQDTSGKIFVVSVIITAELQDKLSEALTRVEISSGKGKLKWGRSGIKQKLAFIGEIFNQKNVSLRICYSHYTDTRDYKSSTILTIAKSINTLPDYTKKVFSIYIDGLSKKDEKYYGTQIRHLGIHTKKVKGVKKDENNPMIRFADSSCGFIRDVLENESIEYKTIFNRAIKKGVLYEV
ncbi:DUF3800 domain-containing protein [Candidatus Amesbacteria bacterium]|nr:DUF3800 domain-containing protein [Candidatus Amesbacteria bacterium]